MIKSNKYLKLIEPILYTIHKFFINKYNECWIPDINEGITLSGDLSHRYRLSANTYFIGILSRFDNIINETVNYDNDLMVILSCPEPQRSIFEDIILSQLNDSLLKVIIVRGKPTKETEINKITDNITVYSHLNTTYFKDKIKNSAIVLCRSGYSTLMDLAIFGKKAILVPTPGQTEQEYLAIYHSKNKLYYTIPQNDFNLNKALINSKGYSGIKLSNDHIVLIERIKRMLSD